METRVPYPTNIDFDESHIEWTRNKRKTQNGMYRYICTGLFQTGKPCNRVPLPSQNVCRIHIADESKHSVYSIETNVSVVDDDKGTLVGSPELCETSTVAQHSPTRQKSNKAGTNRNSPFRSVIWSFWKSRKTAPENNDTDDIKLAVPSINPYRETIHIYTSPEIIGTFTQIRNAIAVYRSIDSIDTFNKIREKRRDPSAVVFHLQLILSFLEGLEELTKLEAKKENVMELKAKILLFFGYDVSTHLHTTRSKWAKTSKDIQIEIITVMGVIFSEFPK
jgi:hypothetical protein